MIISMIGCYIIAPISLYILHKYIDHNNKLLIQKMINYLSKELNKYDSIDLEKNYINITITGKKRRIAYMLNYILKCKVNCVKSSLFQNEDQYTLKLALIPYEVSSLKDHFSGNRNVALIII